jgi:hypothetical protein
VGNVGVMLQYVRRRGHVWRIVGGLENEWTRYLKMEATRNPLCSWARHENSIATSGWIAA